MFMPADESRTGPGVYYNTITILTQARNTPLHLAAASGLQSCVEVNTSYMHAGMYGSI